jgi:hypothetical protein
MTELTEMPVDCRKTKFVPFGCVLICRHAKAVNKSQQRGTIGLFGGIIESITGEEQILVLPVPELAGHSRPYLCLKPNVTFFRDGCCPFRILFQWAGRMPDYFQDLRESPRIRWQSSNAGLTMMDALPSTP